ncbi:MAG: hypothetical protein Q7S37_03255 [bacterium]|nr:hypothetical protein [bacterium]
MMSRLPVIPFKLIRLIGSGFPLGFSDSHGLAGSMTAWMIGL